MDELHIAGLVVRTAPQLLNAIAEQLCGLAGARIHGTSEHGKLVVTLEASCGEEMSQQIARIQRMSGVYSAALVYQCADRLDVMNEEVSHAST